MRLDKFITAASQLSRSQAKAALRAGQVKVNGLLVKQANLKLLLSDQVTLQNQPLKLQEEVYLVFNKPLGYECSKAPSSHPSIFALLNDYAHLSNLNPVGRLDVDTSGLLLLTTNGQWLHQLTHPNKQVSKTYLAELAQPLSDAGKQALLEGIQLRNEAKPCLPAQLKQLAPNKIEITISEGRYHQVRRMFAATNNKVVSLMRIGIAGLALTELKLASGEARELTAAELSLVNEQL